MEQYDFAVIGGGPAGQRAAIQAAKLGKRTVLIDLRKQIGGVTVHTGTLPSKTLRETILYLTGWRQRGFYGHDYRVKQGITIDDLAQRLQYTIRQKVEVIEDQLRRNGVERRYGKARFHDSHTLLIEPQDAEPYKIRADKILLATGTRPLRPKDIPFNSRNIIDSDDLLDLENIPKSAIVFGAGVIGVEYASMFNALDIDITLVNESPELLSFVDREIAESFSYLLRDHGMRMHFGDKRTAVEEDGKGGVRVTFESGHSISADILLFTGGRSGCSEQLALDQVGLEANARGHIAVNEYYQTAVDHIYAAGDIIGFPSLASSSMEQGRIAARHACGVDTKTMPPHFPYGIYAVPEISMIGMTEEALMRDSIPYESGIARFSETARGQILGFDQGLLKLLFHAEDHRLLGAHIVGEGATELIHIGQAVMALGGGLDFLVENVFNYPTLAEAYKIAALDAWNRLR